MNFGLWGSRGLNEITNRDGISCYFKLHHEGRAWEHIFFNVGQPDQDPPIHTDHKDDNHYCDAIRILDCSFYPYFAAYRIFNNTFTLVEHEGMLFMQALMSDSLEWCSDSSPHVLDSGWSCLGPSFYVLGITWGHSLKEELRLAFSPDPCADTASVLDEFIFPRGAGADTPYDVSRQSVFFNLSVSTSLKERFYVPVNKAWMPMIARVTDSSVENYGPMLFAWDAAFSCIILSHHDPDLACATFFSLMEGMQEDGRIPQLRVGKRISNRSNPPVWFLAAWEIYTRTGDLGFLQKAYPLLIRNYNWWKQNRMHQDHTFSWGTDHEDRNDFILLSGKTGAVYESGLDDSPVFDEMELTSQARSGNAILDQACIDLSSLMVSAAGILVEMAVLLGIPAPELQEDLHTYNSIIHNFFDLDRGLVNSFKSQHYNTELSPLIFYPLLTSCISPEELRLLENILDSPDFLNAALLPSVAVSSSHYNPDGDYWRGRVWPSMVWLVAYGLKKHGSLLYPKFKEAAQSILMREWREHGHIHENYSALTGWGEPQPARYARSCPFYSWGGLLGIL